MHKIGKIIILAVLPLALAGCAVGGSWPANNGGYYSNQTWSWSTNNNWVWHHHHHWHHHHSQHHHHHHHGGSSGYYSTFTASTGKHGGYYSG